MPLSFTDGNQIIFLASHDGQAIRFDEEDVRSMGRNATGVRGMNSARRTTSSAWPLRPSRMSLLPRLARRASGNLEGAPVEEVADLIPEKGSLILSVTENGYGKRTPADEYRLTNRGGKGVINVKTTERNGKVSTIAQVSENSQVMLISQYGKIIRIDSKTIRESGRSAQGVRLLNLEPGDRVAAAVVIPPEEPERQRYADSVTRVKRSRCGATRSMSAAPQ